MIFRVAVGLLCSLVSMRAFAADGWTLTTADFNTRPINLVSITDNAINTIDPNDAGISVALDSLLTLQHSQTSPLPGSKMSFFLTHDDRINGEVIELKGEDLRIKSAPLGEVTVPLKRVVAILKTGATLGNLPASRTEDVVTLANGDVVSGIISDLSPTTISVQRSGGEVTAIPTETISRILLASTPADAQSAQKTYRVTLSDNTSISTPTVLLDGVRLQSAAFGEKQSIPTAAVKTIEQINGPVIWTSSLIPDEEIQTPYYGDNFRKSQKDASVNSEPIRFGTQTFAHGIGVHSRSLLTYSIDPSFHVFRTQYAIDGELPWADVTVRIKLDDKLVHETPNVRAGKLSPVVSVDVNGAKKLTLEVDYGENYDVQDRFNWIEPAFLK